jgi:hypothetical protein
MDTKTKAYIAGVIDGEGSIYVERAKRKNGGWRYRIVVSLLMCDQPTVEFIATATGRPMWKKTLSRKGLTRREFGYVLTWRNGPAAAFLKSILPYLRGKRPQAELCLSFHKQVAKVLGVKFTDEDRVICEDLRLKVQALNG